MNEPSPPRLARALVRGLTAADDRAFLIADLEEEFDHIVSTDGAAAARTWYWKQVIFSAPPLVRRRIAMLVPSYTLPAH